jgi:hypothetical protein
LNVISIPSKSSWYGIREMHAPALVRLPVALPSPFENRSAQKSRPSASIAIHPERFAAGTGNSPPPLSES